MAIFVTDAKKVGANEIIIVKNLLMNMACLIIVHVCEKAICFYENCCESKGSICSDCRIIVCLIHTITMKGVNYCEIHADERIKKL
jgi:hypothetical protein